MSLIIKTIVIISITLSNGGRIVYEFDKNLVSKRTTISSADHGDVSVMELLFNGSDSIYEFNLLDVEKSYRTYPITKSDTFLDILSEFDSEFHNVDQHTIVSYTKEFMRDMYMVHHFIELDSIKLPEFINGGFCTVYSNQLFISSDTSIENFERAFSPVSVEITNESEFSKLVQKKIELVTEQWETGGKTQCIMNK